MVEEGKESMGELIKIVVMLNTKTFNDLSLNENHSFDDVS